MRILVTGGAGYIGSVATRLFIDAGHEVIVLDSLERGHRAAVDPRATLVIAPVGDADILDAILPGLDAVVHFAGYIDVAESMRDPDLYHEKNVVEPSVLLERLLPSGVRHVVFSSTAAVYGEPRSVPIPEDAVLAPINPYGGSKAAFEELLRVAESRGQLTAVSLRYFNVAGAWLDGSVGEAHAVETHIVPVLLRAAMRALDGGQADDTGQGTPGSGAREAARFTVFGDDYPTPDGSCVRDYVHVVDLARAHLSALEYLAAGNPGIACNVGSGRGYSNLEVVEACARVTGCDFDVTRGPRREGDPARLVASIERAAEVLGWAPERDLDAMIQDAWSWHRSHPRGYE